MQVVEDAGVRKFCDMPVAANRDHMMTCAIAGAASI